MSDFVVTLNADCSVVTVKSVGTNGGFFATQGLVPWTVDAGSSLELQTGVTQNSKDQNISVYGHHTGVEDEIDVTLHCPALVQSVPAPVIGTGTTITRTVFGGHPVVAPVVVKKAVVKHVVKPVAHVAVQPKQPELPATGSQTVMFGEWSALLLSAGVVCSLIAKKFNVKKV